MLTTNPYTLILPYQTQFCLTHVGWISRYYLLFPIVLSLLIPHLRKSNSFQRNAIPITSELNFQGQINERHLWPFRKVYVQEQYPTFTAVTPPKEFELLLFPIIFSNFIPTKQRTHTIYYPRGVPPLRLRNNKIR